MKLGLVRGFVGFALLLSAACSEKKKEAPAQAPVQKSEAALKAEADNARKARILDLRTKATALFGKLPQVAEQKDLQITEAITTLGRTLYHDPRLSKNQDLSCNSCHAIDGFGVDTRPDSVTKGTSLGHKGQFGGRNAPTTLNAALHVAQFWDGRAANVEEQAGGPVLNPVEMAMPNEAAVIAVLESIPDYAGMFKAAFPGEEKPITYKNMTRAIGAFERQLLTPAPFDKFIAGDDTALSDQALDGFDAFIAAGCIACHVGPGVGGGMYQKLGLIKPYTTKDEGRFAITKSEADKFFFKVPSLRNIAKTGPYFHDGSIKTLGEAIAIMSEHQTPAGRLPDAKIPLILAFLDSLTGEVPSALLAKPALPTNGPKTPGPNPN